MAATIISKDPGNWYDTFMINKGSDDGIRVDNNVIAGKGLVGIVTEVGSSWATVRSIIDDSSSVSAMTVSTSDNCIVTGDLELIDEGSFALNSCMIRTIRYLWESVLSHPISVRNLWKVCLSVM